MVMSCKLITIWTSNNGEPRDRTHHDAPMQLRVGRSAVMLQQRIAA